MLLHRSAALLIVAVLCGLVPRAARAAAPETPGWLLFADRGRALPLLRADAREATFRFGALRDEHRTVYEDLTWGGDLGALHVQLGRDGWLSLTGRGLLSARFDAGSESFDLQNTDFRGGLALAVQQHGHAGELFVYHQSSHLGDEVMERGEQPRRDCGYEALRLLYSATLGAARLYGGLEVVLHGYPDEVTGRTLLRVGGELAAVVLGRPLYVALDLQPRLDELDLHRATMQLGGELGSVAHNDRHQRVFLELYDGFSQMGQMFDRHERYVLVGAGYDFR